MRANKIRIFLLAAAAVLLAGVSIGNLIPRDAEASYLPDAMGWRSMVTSTPTVAGTGAAVEDDIFAVTGSVEMIMWGQVTTASTNMTLLLLENTDDVAISGAGITLTALAAGTMIYRTGGAAVSLSLSDNAAGDVIDPTDAGQNMVHQSFIVTKKTAAATVVRQQYTTTENPDSLVINWYCIWRPLSSDGLVTAS